MIAALELPEILTVTLVVVRVVGLALRVVVRLPLERLEPLEERVDLERVDWPLLEREDWPLLERELLEEPRVRWGLT